MVISYPCILNGGTPLSCVHALSPRIIHDQMLSSYGLITHSASFLQRSAVDLALSRHRGRSSSATASATAQRSRSSRLHAVQKNILTIIEVVGQARALRSSDSRKSRHLLFNNLQQSPSTIPLKRLEGRAWWAGIPRLCMYCARAGADMKPEVN